MENHRVVGMVLTNSMVRIATQIDKRCKGCTCRCTKEYATRNEVTIQQDVTEFLFASMEEVIFTLFLTLGLVFLVVYVFLQDFRSTLIPMIAVPVALIGAFFLPMDVWLFNQLTLHFQHYC